MLAWVVGGANAPLDAVVRMLTFEVRDGGFEGNVVEAVERVVRLTRVSTGSDGC